MRFFAAISAGLVAQRGHLFPWVPVALACGIAAYFALPFEPLAPDYAALALVALVLAGLARVVGPAFSPLCVALVLAALGAGLAGMRAHQVAGPKIEFRYYGPVEGRIVGIDRSASDALRLTLDQVVLADVSPRRVPARVRVSLHGPADHAELRAGARIMTTAHLGPPGGPVEPGGFDFQRHAWFQQIGAVGYTRVPVLLAEAELSGARLTGLRLDLSARVQNALPGERGAFAAAVMTGDRSGMGQDTLVALRASNLAHLLAISGLHMGLLAAFVFAVFRLSLAALPAIGLRVASKKLAAFLALWPAMGYLALSGGNVATERAFVMVAVMLLAVMLDRRALSLRSVALAALVILTLRPEALLTPGFQMSFAATTALIATFALIRDRDLMPRRRWLRNAAAVVVSSGIAGLATAPVAAAYFNQFSHYGLLANVVSVPLMGVVVMPMAVLAACLMPLGLEAAPLWLMGQGLGWILGVAHTVSGWEGATRPIISPTPMALPLIALGALFFILWQGRVRIAGLVPVLAGLLLWSLTERPPVLIAEDGGLVGVMTDGARQLNAPRGSGFVAGIWLENDGDRRDQAEAATHWPGAIDLGAGQRLLVARGTRALQEIECHAGDWLVTNVPAAANARADLPCEVLDPVRLRRTGALAIWPGAGPDQPPRVVAARDAGGARLWNSRPADRHAARDKSLRDRLLGRTTQRTAADGLFATGRAPDAPGAAARRQ